MTHDELARKIVNAHVRLIEKSSFECYDSVDRDGLEDAIAAALKARDVPEGFIRDDKQVDRKVLGTRWRCPYCETFYAEYVNGCPRCHFGEAGTSTSVRVVKFFDPNHESAAESTRDGGTKATPPTEGGTR